MPRRKPRNLDAVRYEMGTYERQLAKDYITVQGIKAAALPVGLGLLGMGVAMAGFLAYNKLDDLQGWVKDGWEDGFGLTNDPAQTQEQVSNYVSPNRTPPGFDGMATSAIYAIHYEMRGDLMAHFSRMYCEYEGKEWTGPEDEFFKKYYWSTSWLGTGGETTGFTSDFTGTFRFERPEVIQIAGEDVNEISEYTYQMIIRETDSRNTQARLTSGIFGVASSGLWGGFASEATHALLRGSGFMRGSDGWNGQNWEEAPGANRDPLLMFAWGRTDFQTGKWWSTIDSQGDVAFWADVMEGRHGGARIQTNKQNPIIGMKEGYWNYEQIIYFAHEEMTNSEFGPFIQYLSTQGGLPLVTISPPIEPAIPTGEGGEPDQDPEAPDDDHMGPPDDSNPDKDDPTKEAYWRERGEQPPPGWQPS